MTARFTAQGWRAEYPLFAAAMSTGQRYLITFLLVAACAFAFGLVAALTGWNLHDYSLSAGGCIYGARHLATPSPAATREGGE